MELTTKFGEVKIFAKTIEEDALSQIIQMANSPLGDGAHLRIMPDCHAGAGCTIGTTMKIVDKVCPNLVGVDIGCGVDLVRLDVDLADKCALVDEIIKSKIPYGRGVQNRKQKFDFARLRCWGKLKQDSKSLAEVSLGTLGGGNHFIEAYAGGWLAVHSGSRNIGFKVAEFYQNLAAHTCFADLAAERAGKPAAARGYEIKFNKELAYLTGQNMEDYLHDIGIMQEFAALNRRVMLETIAKGVGGKIVEWISSVHNYIDIEHGILRKGAISAQAGERLVIPLNMRDGILVCVGKGNPDWNFSAPHGAGRLYSRSQAKQAIALEDYKKSMEGIYTTCVSQSTIDESPFAYKNFEEIVECVEPTVEILERIRPIYNFKASE